MAEARDSSISSMLDTMRSEQLRAGSSALGNMVSKLGEHVGVVVRNLKQGDGKTVAGAMVGVSVAAGLVYAVVNDLVHRPTEEQIEGLKNKLSEKTASAKKMAENAQAWAQEKQDDIRNKWAQDPGLPGLAKNWEFVEIAKIDPSSEDSPILDPERAGSERG